MANEPNLSPSMTSEWVLYLQQLLNQYYNASVVPESGDFDETTADVVRSLRESAGLDSSSEVDQGVWRLLVPEDPGGGSGGETGGSQDDQTGGTNETGAGASDPWPEADSIKVWINAFIPGSYHGNIDGVGEAAGLRLLPGPSTWVNDCFRTDDRDFSTDITASHRMHSEIRIDLANLTFSEWQHCGETVEHDCEDGDVECRATASTDRMHWSNLRREGPDVDATVSSDRPVVRVDIAAAANNPCWAGSADIDYVGTVTVDPYARTVTFQGLVNGFPAYEAYVAVNDGAGQTLFQHGPTGDPTDLVGAADLAVSGSVTF